MRLREVATTLDTSVETVPETVESLTEKVRSLQTALEKCRKRWATTTSMALRQTVTAGDGAVIVHLPGGIDDATALATALDRSGVTAVCAHHDHTFVVRSPRERDPSAVDVAQSAVADLSGGAGGSDTFAQGGTESDHVFEMVESACETTCENPPVVVDLRERGRT
jgi:alanyl-tRNA synthetase